MEHLSISDPMKNKTLSFSSFFKYDCFEGNICIRLLYKVYEKKKRMDGKIFAKKN